MRFYQSGGNKIRLGKGSRIVAERWYYDPTYLHDGHDQDVMMFTRHFAIVETAVGNRTLRMAHDAEAFDDFAAMAVSIRERRMSEAPQEYNADRKWYPPELGGW
jgi:hypothetical protein